MVITELSPNVFEGYYNLSIYINEIPDAQIEDFKKVPHLLQALRKIAEEDPALYMKAVTKEMLINYT